MSLSNIDTAFQGLENHLTSIYGDRRSEDVVTFSVQWKQLKNFKKLQSIEMRGVNLGDISEPFPELLSLSLLQMLDSNISSISEKAFYSLKNLKSVTLSYNGISEVKRSMFPEPADYLTSIYMS